MKTERWARNHVIPASTIRDMAPEAVKEAILMGIEIAEHEAGLMGVEEPKVLVMFATEFLTAEIMEEVSDG